MKFQKLFLSAVLLTSTATILTVAPTANAATNDSKPVAVVENKANFTKKGYIMRVLNDRDASPIYVGKANYHKLVKNVTPAKGAKTISPKKVQKVKFRIEKVLNVKGRGAGAPVYLVASKDKKYSTWTTQAFLQYYYLNSKSMQDVTKPLKRIANRLNTSLKKANSKRDFGAAMKAAKKLRGSQRDFRFTFIESTKEGWLHECRRKELVIIWLVKLRYYVVKLSE
jgi:hypothetical protein